MPQNVPAGSLQLGTRAARQVVVYGVAAQGRRLDELGGGGELEVEVEDQEAETALGVGPAGSGLV